MVTALSQAWSPAESTCWPWSKFLPIDPEGSHTHWLTAGGTLVNELAQYTPHSLKWERAHERRGAEQGALWIGDI